MVGKLKTLWWHSNPRTAPLNGNTPKPIAFNSSIPSSTLDSISTGSLIGHAPAKDYATFRAQPDNRQAFARTAVADRAARPLRHDRGHQPPGQQRLHLPGAVAGGAARHRRRAAAVGARRRRQAGRPGAGDRVQPVGRQRVERARGRHRRRQARRRAAGRLGRGRRGGGGLATAERDAAHHRHVRRDHRQEDRDRDRGLQPDAGDLVAGQPADEQRGAGHDAAPGSQRRAASCWPPGGRTTRGCSAARSRIPTASWPRSTTAAGARRPWPWTASPAWWIWPRATARTRRRSRSPAT